MQPLKLLPVLTTLLLACYGCHNTGPLFPKDVTNENERNNTLFVFVGEKIEVKEIPYNGQMMGGALVTAKYKILQRVYGEYQQDTITFEAYDHYGAFPFANYKNVLMFVSKSKETGKYYQEEYQYFDVYKTKTGRWASSYKSREYKDPKQYYTAVIPEKIDFAEDVSYPTKVKDDNGKEINVHFPDKYYKTEGDKAIAVYGNYIEELFRLKKEGVLTARHLFGDSNAESDVQDVTLADVSEPMPYKTDQEFFAFWGEFGKAIKQDNLQRFREIAFDSIWCGGVVVTATVLYKNCFHEIFDNQLVEKFGDSTAVGFYQSSIGWDGILLYAAKRIVQDKGDYLIRKVQVTRLKNDEQPWIVTFDFIKTDNGFKLYGYKYSKGWETCP